jgi:hypothetical protein
LLDALVAVVQAPQNDLVMPDPCVEGSVCSVRNCLRRLPNSKFWIVIFTAWHVLPQHMLLQPTLLAAGAMKLTFRTINGSTFNVEAEGTTTVGDLKANVESSQGSQFPKDQLKLIYKGKVLDDDAKTVSDYGVDESGFLVVFMQKKAEGKPAAAAVGAPSSATPAAAEVRCSRQLISIIALVVRCMPCWHSSSAAKNCAI